MSLFSFGEDSNCEDCHEYLSEIDRHKAHNRLLEKRLEKIKEYLIFESTPPDASMSSMNEMMCDEAIAERMRVMLKKFFNEEKS